ncbi:MAG: outer membrane protein assembly factor BamA [Gammaproteobacteria bacterium]|nr:outer membrane protein assembly factor BamA [Gammaproteobacteria bacterium]NNJ48994.1 outer membrane protein assembly factor BamA [Gammaproteobacteria bacterium]
MSIIRLSLILILVNCLAMTVAHADAFVVSEIKIEGLQRIPDGTLLNYMPIVVGDPIDDNQITYAISELYKTGFFADIQLFRDGDILLVRVKERPSIADVEFTGNSDIDDDALKDALVNIGVTRGQIYNRSLLEKLTLELENVYFSQGKYGVKINTEVTDLDQNRVDIDITISEGQVALIKHINIVGNEAYDDETLLDELESGVPSAWALFSSADEYSKPKLNGDLEKIRSYYLDRGYIRFTIESTQVSITPDKQDIYITVNVSEGDRYKISSSKLTGDLVVNRQTMESQIFTRQGMYFSRSLMTSSKKRLEDQMGRIGYAFSEVKVTPDIDDERKEVSLTYFAIPGEKVYVRRIDIYGNDSTQDQVFRREMRLMEGSILASDLLERSKTRIQRLPYVETVSVDTAPVPGSSNQVDLKVKVEEKLAGSFNIGAGFSQTQGLIFNVGLTQENLFGTGKRLALNVNTDRANTIYSGAYTNPYYTIDGISRTVSVSFRDRDATEELINNFQTNSGDLNISYGIPLSEFNTLSLGYGFSYIKIIPSTINPSVDVTLFLAENDGRTRFNSFTLNTSFSHDTRNRTVFANAGSQQTVGINMTVPGSDLEYYKINYVTNTYIGVTSATTLLLRSNLAYGDGYGKTRALPFFERYFAGGIRTVRGFESNSLGPRDPVSGFAVGGNLRVTGGADYIFPIPFVEKPPSSLRLSLFLDIGNVYLNNFHTFDAEPGDNGFQVDQLRSSYGASLVWISPIGPLRFSYAETINDVPGDDLRAFQFSIGSFF